MSASANVYNEQPYYNYIYNEWGQSVPIPNAYEPIKNMTGIELGVGSFKNASNIFIDRNTELLYLLDSENNRIVVMDVNFNLQYVIGNIWIDDVKFKNSPKTLNKPQGIFVNSDGIYLADTENERLLILKNDLLVGLYEWKEDTETKTFSYVKNETAPAYMRTAVVEDVITKPNDLTKTTKTDIKSITFKVEQVVVNDQVIYLLVKGIYEGAVTLERYYVDEAGVKTSKYRFIGYFGSNNVEQTAEVLSNYFWRKILPKTATDSMARAVPNRFTNFDIDKEGFIYTVTRESETNRDQVRKINIMGDNVLRNKHSVGGAQFGDLEMDYYLNKVRNNDFVAIDINDLGLITVVCNEYNRLYQYDQESNLLFTFGGTGTQLGTFRLPLAVESFGDRIYVLDKGDEGVSSITVFEPTEFGNAVIDAVVLHQKGDYLQAIPKWEKVKEYSMNYDLAYIGIGKAKYQLYEYEEALENFYLGRDRTSYSEAFKDYRKDFVRDHFFIILVALILIVYVIKLTIKHKDKILMFIFRNNETLVKKVKYPFYIMLHPIKGFSELLHSKNGSVAIANVILVIYFLVQVLARQKTGFIFNPNNLDELNALYILAGTIILVMIWNVSNWAFCTLANGKGKFKDIYITTAYSLLPFIVFGLINIGLSNVVSQDEGIILYYITMLQNIWFGVLLTLANMTIHHYTLKKTIFSMFVTVLGVQLTIFIGILIFGLFQQLTMFISSLINEMLFRL